MEITLRPFVAGDAEAVLRVHYAAVHETGASHYDQETRQQWSPPVGSERIAEYLRRIAAEEQVTLVALHNEAIVGFGTVVPAINELRAVYVLPSCGRRGVGSQLLRAVEQLARNRNLNELRLDSSLNAEAFYLAQGYKSTDRRRIELRSGLSIATVQMNKAL